MGIRTIFIGDVHGCLDELNEMINILRPDWGDRIVFVGDLVDRGPESVLTLSRVRSLLATYPGSACVSGNHEEKSSRMFKKNKPQGHNDNWFKDMDEGLWEFIDSMPLMWYCNDLNIRVVHGGIEPYTLEKYPYLWEAVKEYPDWRKGGGKVLKRARKVLRVRRIDKETGKMITLADCKPTDPYWADLYPTHLPKVIYGHEPFDEIKISENAIGIDTGCCFGNKLTALVFEDNNVDYEVVQVKARKKYCEPWSLK